VRLDSRLEADPDEGEVERGERRHSIRLGKGKKVMKSEELADHTTREKREREGRKGFAMRGMCGS
jgi:hypothetical protein